MRIDEIKLAGRHRADLGDIEALAASIRDVGLLQPVVVTFDGLLIGGQRRIAAAKSLGWTEIDTHVVAGLDDAAAILRAERDENTCRKPFTPSEEFSLYEALLTLESEAARERMSEGGKGEKLSHPLPEPKRARQAAAEAATGSPGRYKTLDKVGEVKAAAEDEAKPEPVRETARAALADMDATGRVDGNWKRVKDAERAVTLTPSPAVTDYLESSPVVADSGYVRRFMAALAKSDDLLSFDAEKLATLLDEDEAAAVSRFAASAGRFAETLRRSRSGLRVINGGK